MTFTPWIITSLPMWALALFFTWRATKCFRLYLIERAKPQDNTDDVHTAGWCFVFSCCLTTLFASIATRIML